MAELSSKQGALEEAVGQLGLTRSENGLLRNELQVRPFPCTLPCLPLWLGGCGWAAPFACAALSGCTAAKRLHAALATPPTKSRRLLETCSPGTSAAGFGLCTLSACQPAAVKSPFGRRALAVAELRLPLRAPADAALPAV